MHFSKNLALEYMVSVLPTYELFKFGRHSRSRSGRGGRVREGVSPSLGTIFFFKLTRKERILAKLRALIFLVRHYVMLML